MRGRTPTRQSIAVAVLIVVAAVAALLPTPKHANAPAASQATISCVDAAKLDAHTAPTTVAERATYTCTVVPDP